MKNSITNLIPAVVLTLLVYSCKKAPVCTENCATINANGVVINKLTNTPVPNVPVALCWIKFVATLSQRETITKVKSKADGTFNFNANIDTSNFRKGYSLALRVDATKEYMILGYSGLISKYVYSFDPNAFQSIQLEVYKRASLKVNLYRIQSDNFKSFSIAHSVVDNNTYINDYSVQSAQEVIDAHINAFTISTVPDVYTKIRVIKTDSNGVSNTTVDSIKCSATSPNTYDVRF